MEQTEYPALRPSAQRRAAFGLASLLVVATICASFRAVTGRLFVLPEVALAALAAITIGAIIKAARARAIGQATGALVLVIVAAFLVWLSPDLFDGFKFVGWAPFHVPMLVRASHQDSVISYWDGWGFAGMDNDSYLVTDAANDLSSASGVARWQSHIEPTCEVVHARRLLPRIYVAITYECTVPLVRLGG